MLEAYSRAWAEIDYDAIAHNCDEIKKLVGSTKIMGIVKANAYGLGDIQCAQALRAWGVDFLGFQVLMKPYIFVRMELKKRF